MSDEKLRAIALVRAAIEEDGEAVGLLVGEPVTLELVQHLTAIAASSLERGLGTERAVEVTASWARVTLEEIAAGAGG